MTTDQNTAPLDLDGLERLLRGADPKHSILIRHSEALALISQAREAERMRGAGNALDDALLGLRDAFIKDGIYNGPKGAAIKAMNAAIKNWRALAPAKGGGE